MTIEEIRVVFGERLRRLRIEKKLGQMQTANILETEVSKLNKWEHGVSIPGAVVLRQLAEFYGVTIDYLLGMSDQMTHENVNLCAALGLSETAVLRLQQIKQIGANDALSALLSSVQVIHALSALANIENFQDVRGPLAILTETGLEALQEGRDSHATFVDVSDYVRVFSTRAKEALSKGVDEATNTILNGGEPYGPQE